mgnify:FL=1
MNVGMVNIEALIVINKEYTYEWRKNAIYQYKINIKIWVYI